MGLGVVLVLRLVAAKKVPLIAVQPAAGVLALLARARDSRGRQKLQARVIHAIATISTTITSNNAAVLTTITVIAVTATPIFASAVNIISTRINSTHTDASAAVRRCVVGREFQTQRALAGGYFYLGLWCLGICDYEERQGCTAVAHHDLSS